MKISNSVKRENVPTSGMRVVGLAGGLLDGIEDRGVSLRRDEAFNVGVVSQEGVEGLEAGSGGQITKRHFEELL